MAESTTQSQAIPAGEAPDIVSCNEMDAVVAEIIDAFEEARLVRQRSQNSATRHSMDCIRRSLTMAVRRLAPYSFHAERWLGEEVEQWPDDQRG